MDEAKALYLDLMKKCLTNFIYGDTETIPVPTPAGYLKRRLLEVCMPSDARLIRPRPFDPNVRVDGRDWPVTAHTMIGLKRLDNLQSCIEDVLARRVPGDVLEAGVWRGGASIFMRAVLKAHGVTDRIVWLADSFQGLPRPDPERCPPDRGDTHYTYEELAVSLEQVRANFSKYGLLDDRVRFLEGWFKDTLAGAPIERLAVIRLDGDMYESTMDSLTALYDRLSVGGYVIIDDYGYLPACREAVHDFRGARGIADEIHRVDWTGAYWRRSS